MRTQPVDVAAEVFHTVAACLVQDAESLIRMAATGYSFEEWVNWNAFLVCHRRWGGNTAPKPGYRYFELADTAEMADLWVQTPHGEKVIVEVGLVHDHTSDKWIEKLAYDRKKLEAARADSLQRLQLVVLVSAKEAVVDDEKWEAWLRRALPEPADLNVHALDGQVAVRGWHR